MNSAKIKYNDNVYFFYKFMVDSLNSNQMNLFINKSNDLLQQGQF